MSQLKTNPLPWFVAKGHYRFEYLVNVALRVNVLSITPSCVRSHLADAAPDHDAVTVQLLKLFDAAVLIALVHISRRDREVPYTAGCNAGNLNAQRYIDKVLEPVVTLRSNHGNGFVIIGGKARPHCAHVTND